MGTQFVLLHGWSASPLHPAAETRAMGTMVAVARSQKRPEVMVATLVEEGLGFPWMRRIPSLRHPGGLWVEGWGGR
jgi:hypothetical protein